MPESVVVIKLDDWFVWLGWRKARNAVIHLIADFFAVVSLWILYALFVAIAHWLIVDQYIVVIVETIHSLGAVLVFSLLAGLGIQQLLCELIKPSPH
jgi:hypothetical protein